MKLPNISDNEAGTSRSNHPKLKYSDIYLRGLENTLRQGLVKIRREINEILEGVTCVGFLISEDLVYTAAHCLIDHKLISFADEIDRQIQHLRVQTFPGASSGPHEFMFRVRFLLIHSLFEETEDKKYNADFGIIKVSFTIINFYKDLHK